MGLSPAAYTFELDADDVCALSKQRGPKAVRLRDSLKRTEQGGRYDACFLTVRFQPN